MKTLWLIVAILWAISWVLPPTEITVYPLHCRGTVTGNICEGDLDFGGNISSYTASPRRQEVLHHGGFGVSRLEGCEVMSSDTWTCRFEDAAGRYTYDMDHGTYTEYFFPSASSTSTLRPEFIHVPGWQYYLHAANASRKQDVIGTLETALCYVMAVWTLL
jgi:hypothetical protein